jgi:hypothetical protein
MKLVAKILMSMSLVGVIFTFFIAPDTQRPDTQVQTQPEPEGLPVQFIKSGFGCDDRYVAEGIGTMKDALKALKTGDTT